MIGNGVQPSVPLTSITVWKPAARKENWMKRVIAKLPNNLRGVSLLLTPGKVLSIVPGRSKCICCEIGKPTCRIKRGYIIEAQKPPFLRVHIPGQRTPRSLYITVAKWRGPTIQRRKLDLPRATRKSCYLSLYAVRTKIVLIQLSQLTIIGKHVMTISHLPSI